MAAKDTRTRLATGLKQPKIAVDYLGDVFVADADLSSSCNPRFAGSSRLSAMQDGPASITSYTGTHPRTIIVKIDGPFTLPNIFPFQEKLAFLKAHEVIRTLIVDVSSVPYIDSAGLGILINLYVSAEKNAQMFFLAGANERVTALLETAKVHTLIRSYPTVSDVEAMLKP